MKNGKKILMTVGYLIAVCVMVPLCIFASAALVENYYQWKFGNNTVWILTGRISGLPVLSCGILLVIWCYFIFSKRKKDVLPLALIGTVFLLVLSVLGTNWFHRFTTEGVERQRFWRNTVYIWEDVNTFSLKADHDGVLVYELHMEDGSDFSLNDGAVEYCSDVYNECFPEGNYDYLVWLTEQLAEQGIPFQNDNLEKVKKKLDYDSWIELAETISETYEKTIAEK